MLDTKDFYITVEIRVTTCSATMRSNIRRFTKAVEGRSEDDICRHVSLFVEAPIEIDGVVRF